MPYIVGWRLQKIVLCISLVVICAKNTTQMCIKIRTKQQSNSTKAGYQLQNAIFDGSIFTT